MDLVRISDRFDDHPKVKQMLAPPKKVLLPELLEVQMLLNKKVRPTQDSPIDYK